MKKLFESMNTFINKSIEMETVKYKLADSITECYNALDEPQKMESLKIIIDLLSDDIELCIYILNIILTKTKDIQIEIEILKIINSRNMLLEKKIVLFKQVIYYSFVYQDNSAILYSSIIDTYKNLVKNIRSLTCFEKMNEEKSKCVVLMISPLVGEAHAPTRILINMAHYLYELGYGVIVLSVSTGKLQKSFVKELGDVRVDNAMFRTSQTFDTELLGVQLYGGHFDVNRDNLRETAQNIVDTVVGINPEFILSIGAPNFFADLFADDFNLITLGTTNGMPITLAKNVWNYFKRSDELLDYINRTNTDGKRIYNFDLVMPKCVEEINDISRNTYGISNEDFIILIAGNRLDKEVTDEVLKLMVEILKIDSRIKYLIIGLCEDVKKKITLLELNNRVIFTGNVDSFSNTIALGDLFLNPPRQGAATGALFALDHNIPIMTLDNCDVASFVDEKFICKKMEEYIELVKKYIYDTEFMEEQKKHCELLAIDNKDESKCMNQIEKMLEIIGG